MNKLKSITHSLVSWATCIDLEIDECRDELQRKELLKKYVDGLDDYDLFEGRINDGSDDPFSNCGEPFDVCPFVEDGKVGIRNERTIILSPIYDGIEPIEDFIDNRFYVTLEHKTGMVSVILKEDGSCSPYWSVPLEYDQIVSVGFCRYLLQKEGQWYYRENDMMSEPLDDVYYPRYGGWVRACRNGVWGWLDVGLKYTSVQSDAHIYRIPQAADVDAYSNLDTSLVTRKDLDNMSFMEDRLKASAEDFPDVWLNVNGDVVVDGFSYRIIEEQGRYGVEDHLGCQIVKPIYLELVKVGERTIMGRKSSGWGVVILQTEMVDELCPFFFDEMPVETNHGFIVKHNGAYGLYDLRENHFVLPPVYSEILCPDGYSHVVLKRDEKFGFYDGNVLIEPQYDEIWWGRSLSFVRFRKGTEWGYINNDQEWISDMFAAHVIAVNPLFSADCPVL